MRRHELRRLVLAAMHGDAVALFDRNRLVTIEDCLTLDAKWLTTQKLLFESFSNDYLRHAAREEFVYFFLIG